MTKEEQKQRELIIKCIKNLINTNLSVLDLHKTIFKKNKESMVAIEKNIRISKKALRNIEKIQHIEILRSIYQNVISGKEAVFAFAPALINSKKCKYWDTTKKGFEEFTILENEANEIAKKKLEQQIKEQQMVEQAKKEGKKVEYVYDNTEKRNKPMIIEENNNA